ncbi:MAG: RNA polymerase sigma factor, partial [Leucothrix sp.]
AIDSLRREKSATKNQCPIVDDYEVADDESSGPMMATVWAEKHEKLKELLVVLNAVERQMVTLAFYRGMSHTEIAAHTGRPLGSVKTILRRAQSALKSAFKRGYILAPLSHHVT